MLWIGLPDTEALLARKLTSCTAVHSASSRYLASRPAPATRQDLLCHDGLVLVRRRGRLDD